MKIIMIIQLDVMKKNNDNSIRCYENNNGNSISN